MGGTCSSNTIARKVLMIGPTSSGKTHLLYRWSLGDGVDITTRPTEGFNVEKVQCKGLVLLVWDVSDVTRRRQFFDGTEVLVYVIDSSDKKGIENAQKDIKTVVRERDLCNTPILVVATKQDIEGCLSVDEVQSQLELNTLAERKFSVVGTSINSWNSVHSALNSLCDLILQTA